MKSKEEIDRMTSSELMIYAELLEKIVEEKKRKELKITKVKSHYKYLIDGIRYADGFKIYHVDHKTFKLKRGRNYGIRK